MDASTTSMTAAPINGPGSTTILPLPKTTNDNKKPFKVKDVTRSIKKAVCAATLEEIRSKVAEKFEKFEQTPTIHLDSDGTEIDDEEYFRTLDENTELIAVFPGEHWIDPTHYVTITSHRNENHDTIDAASETARIKQLVGQLQNNLCNVSVMNDADLDSLSNMDPNSLVDITGKEFMEQLKDSGRPLCAKRTAEDRLNLLKLLKAGAIFCSERYPEDAEAIDMEISRQLNVDNSQNMKTITTKLGVSAAAAFIEESTLPSPLPPPTTSSSTSTTSTSSSSTPSSLTTTMIKTQISNTKTIEIVQDAEANIAETLVSNIVTVTVTDTDQEAEMLQQEQQQQQQQQESGGDI